MQFTSSRYLFDLSFTLLGAFVCFRRLPLSVDFSSGTTFHPTAQPYGNHQGGLDPIIVHFTLHFVGG